MYEELVSRPEKSNTRIKIKILKPKYIDIFDVVMNFEYFFYVAFSVPSPM